MTGRDPESRWASALELFDRWQELSPAAQREELDRLEADDPQVHAKLLSLLDADAAAEAGRFLQGTAILDAGPLPEAAPPPPPIAKVGPWTLEKSIGAGGMGRVWLARRDDGLYDGLVAIKMLREAVADEFANERFAREGQILARLSHPNIARLLDAGTLADGQRYLVIEYVLGQRIDRHCDEMRLDINARIGLFLQVCAAVSHAHGNLVVHRDLKPANILVQDDGQVKLLDFGVAKLIERDGATAEPTPLTLVAAAGLTPEYAAPEQIDGGPITTATDVYSLGLVLYRLLTGNRPYGEDAASPARLARDIVDTEARRPSQSINGPWQGHTRAIAASRATTPERLRRQLRGDLDNILARTLRKKPGERYPSVQALADDLENFLANRPVTAREDSLGYRVGKFVARHRVGVAATAALIVAIIGGVAGVLWQARIAIEQRAEAERQAAIARDKSILASNESEHARAEAARANAEEAEARKRQAEAERYRAQAALDAQRARENEAKARHETEQANAVKNFMVDIFRANLPASADAEQVKQLTARQLLDVGSQRIAVKFADQPNIRADLLDIVGELYYRLGDYDRAKQLTEERIQTLTTLKRDTRGDQLTAYHNLAILAGAAGNPSDQRRAVEAARPFVGADGDKSDSSGLLRLAEANLYRAPLESIALATAGLNATTEQDHLTLRSNYVSSVQRTIALANQMLGRDDQAVAAAQAALSAQAHVGTRGTYSLAAAEALVGRIEADAEMRHRSETRVRNALQVLDRTLGKGHPLAIDARALLGDLLHRGPDHAEGMSLLREAERQSTRSVRRNLIDESRIRLALANAEFRDGRLGDAEALVATVLAATRDNEDLRLLQADALILDSRLRAVRGDTELAFQAADQARAIRSESLGEAAPPVAEALLAMAEALFAADRVGEARALLNTAEKLPAVSGRRLAIEQMARETLMAEFRLWWGEADAARLAFAAIQKRLEADPERDRHGELEARLLLDIGRASFVRGLTADARQALARAVALRQARGSADNPWLAEAQIALADYLISQGELQHATRLLDAAAATYARNQPLSRRYLYPLEKVRQRLQAG